MLSKRDPKNVSGKAFLFHAQLNYSIPVGAFGLRIGRSGENQVVIPDRSVSRYHAQVYQSQGRYYLQDLNSAAGVFVNGYRVVGQTELQPGDTITIGSTNFLFRFDGSVGQPPDRRTASVSGKRNQFVYLGIAATLLIILMVVVSSGGTKGRNQVGSPQSAQPPLHLSGQSPVENPSSEQILPRPTKATPTLHIPTIPIQPKVPTIDNPGKHTAVASNLQLNPRDIRSLTRNFIQMIDEKDVRFLKGIQLYKYLFMSDNPIEGGQNVNRSTFFQDLQKRMDLSGKISCHAVQKDAESITFWTKGWTSEWTITEFCYGECRKIDPPVRSSQAGFLFSLEGTDYVLRSILVGDFNPDYWDPFREKSIYPCDPDAL